MNLTVIWLSALCWLWAFTDADVYTSTSHLETVLRIESQVVKVLGNYLRSTEEKLERIRRYIQEFEQAEEFHNNQHQDEDEATFAEHIVANPLHSFHMMKRLTYDWSIIESTMTEHGWDDALQEVQRFRSQTEMPHDEDLQGAALAIIRLKNTYHLNVTELSSGYVSGIPSSAGLNARDCLYLGKNSFHSNMLDDAIEWYQQALMAASAESDTTAPHDEIQPWLDQALERRMNITRSNGIQMPLRQAISSADYSEIDKPKYRLGNDIGPADDTANYRALCRGEKLLGPAETSKLKCFVTDRDDPYFSLQPLKMEQHFNDPAIYTIHNVLSDHEVEVIKELAKPSLQRSTVVGKTAADREISLTRTSQNTWIFMDDLLQSPELIRITKRIGYITKLNVWEAIDAEELQIANYGIGGHYDPHHDYLFKDRNMPEVPDNEKIKGDRIATFMFYLSDVTRGGATVFPRLGAAVWPRKGAAAFWHNLKLNGRADSRTLHGACPVLHGTKWVANKWIREMNQPFRRPCSTNPDE